MNFMFSKPNFEKFSKFQNLSAASRVVRQVNATWNIHFPYTSAGSSPSYSASDPFPVKVPAKAVDDSSSTWAPASHVRDVNKLQALGFSLSQDWLSQAFGE